MLLENNETQEQSNDQDAAKPTPELVREIADRVFQLLKDEARIDYERRRRPFIGRHFGQGGR